MDKYITDRLFDLTAIASPTGFTKEVTKFIFEEFFRLGYEPQFTKKGCVLCELGGEGRPLLIAGHADTLGGMVAEIKANGRLVISPLGGLKAANTETENVVIHTRDGKVFEGTFQLCNASVHVNREYSTTERSFSNMEVVIDEKSTTKKETESLGIAVGDIVAFDSRTRITEKGFIKSRFLDDKLAVAIILGLAKYLKDNKVKLNRKVYIFISTYEEVGHGSSGGFPEMEEMLCVDMGCVGDGLSATERDVSICVKDASGPYDFEMTSKLIKLAKEKKLGYATDVYPFYASDASAALVAGKDMRCALIGPGVYASHGYERSHIDGVKNTFELIKAYLEIPSKRKS